LIVVAQTPAVHPQPKIGESFGASRQNTGLNQSLVQSLAVASEEDPLERLPTRDSKRRLAR
jgi:hypothetical protein